MKKSATKFLVFAFSVFSFLLAYAPHAHASTIVSSDITENTTWDISGSPYLISTDIFIPSGVTLNIDAGVIVKFDYWTEINVGGSIITNGTESEPVYFTSFYDDSLGGDDDGTPGTTGGLNDYLGFIFSTGSIGEFSHIVMKYSSSAISSTNANLSISYGEFVDNYGGIEVLGGEFSILNSTCRNTENPVVVDVSTIFTHAGNTFIDNTNNGFIIQGSVISGTYTFLSGDAPYIISNYISVDSGAVVQISPGVVIQSDWNGGGFDVNGGTLNIDGESANRAVLEYINVDSYNHGQAIINNTDMRGGVINSYYNGGVILNNSTIDYPSNSPVAAYLDGSVELNNSSITNTPYYRDVIAVFSNGNFAMNNSVLDGGGEGVDVFSHGVVSIEHSVIKNMNDSAIIAYGRSTEPLNEISISFTEMFGNYIGLFPDGNTNIMATNNSIHDNEYGAYEYRTISYDFSNNWWGDATGPFQLETNGSGLGNEIYGPILFMPWLTRDPLVSRPTPVLIIPGVLGTEIEKPTEEGPIKLWLDILHNLTDIGDQFMDPLIFNDDLTPRDDSLVLGEVIGKTSPEILSFNYTERLISELNLVGYTTNDIFTLPYDWRYGVNIANVDALTVKINEIRTITGSDSVDVVAHSTGGLLVKKYVIEHPATHHIRKAVFVGVPNIGAPKALKALLAGDNFGIPPLSQKEMKKLARNFPVVYDLLPSREYYNRTGPYMKTIDRYLRRVEVKNLTYDETRDLLVDSEHDLNNTALTQAEALHTSDFDNFDLRTTGVNIYAIDGCRAYTPVKITEIHNHILGGISYVMPSVYGGDGTVPLESSTALPIDEGHKYYARNANHAEMMGQDGIREQIVNILSGSTLTVSDSDITQDISRCSLNGRAFAVYSPVAISIIDSFGNYAHVSEDGDIVENTITNAGYEVWDDHKFVYLPTDDGQTYTVTLLGTGTGYFTITDTHIDNGEVLVMQVYTHISVNPDLRGVLSFAGTISLDTNNDGDIDSILSPDKTLTANEAQDFDPTYSEQESSNTTTQSGGSHGHQVKDTQVQEMSVPEFISSVELSDIVVSQNTQSNTVIEGVNNNEEVPQKNSLNDSRDTLEQGNLLANVVSSEPKDIFKYVLVVGGLFVVIYLGKKLIRS